MANEVVKLEYIDSSIALIRMEDRVFSNTFSAGMINGIKNSFNNLREGTKVVVLTGYENYFCCGGTKEELLDLTKGDTTFDEFDFYRILLDCELPTIAAMQGHALGGGLALGCYADIIVMSEESLYSTNFMKYGFTPGMGSTYIVPKKLGQALGNEMLFSAKNYHGGELKQRGASVNIVKRQEVLNTALSIAAELSEKPLVSLKLLKNHLASNIRHELPDIIKKEIAMHAISFKLPEVIERINTLFGK
jgi:polyketide biosynthesis enoyl-CoA hydratase PksI